MHHTANSLQHREGALFHKGHLPESEQVSGKRAERRRCADKFGASAIAVLIGSFVALGAPDMAKAQSDTPQEGGVLHVAVAPEPPGLMLGLVQNAPTQMISPNIYESLLAYAPDLSPQPSLAESWEVSDDELTYTFTLRQGVKWHDGTDFTADDVVFSLDVFLREVHPRWRPIAQTRVESIEKIDDYQVQIKLNEPFDPITLAFEAGMSPIVPKHIYDGTDYRTNPMNNTPIGTGPMKFEEWRSGSYVHLVKNEDYYLEGKPYLDEVFYHFIPDSASRAVAYRNGTVDVLAPGSVEYFEVAQLAEEPGTCVTTNGWEMFSPLTFVHLNVRSGPLASREFRQGLMYAMDREFAIDALWDGFGVLATSPIASTTRFYSDDTKTYEYDPERARELIEASGYSGEPLKFLVLPYAEVWTRWAEIIRENFADVGVELELITTDVAGWTERVANWDFDMTHQTFYQYGDPAIGVARAYISSNIIKGSPFANVGGYSNPEVDALFDEAATAAREQRPDLYKRVQDILMEDVPLLWLIEEEKPTVYRCEVQDMVTTAIGINDGLRNAWIAQED